MSNDARSLGMGHDDAPQGWRGAADGGHQGEKLGVPEGGGGGGGGGRGDSQSFGMGEARGNTGT
eukprot:COSAG02_NODE_2308_length_9172_cov_5.357214_1_plen_63_part_10